MARILSHVRSAIETIACALVLMVLIRVVPIVADILAL